MNPGETPQFWKHKPFGGMTEIEWDSLCSRCGICCLNRIHDGNNGNVQFTKIACSYLDTNSCHCTVYDRRFQVDTGCNRITPEILSELKWLPKTCGYRTVFEGRDLEWWHPLISGNPNTVHQAGISIQHADIISESEIIAGDLLKSIFVRPF